MNQNENFINLQRGTGGASLVAQMVNNLTANVGDVGSIPGSGRSSGEGNGNPLQYSCYSIPWTNHGVAKSWTQPSN